VPVNGATPAVNIALEFDYDLAGRLAARRDLGVNGTTKATALEYWPDSSAKRRQMADGSWTRQYIYDIRGNLVSIDNANTTSATEPDLYVSAATFNARGQPLTMTSGNGVTSTYTYNDQRGFLSRILTQNGATTLLDQTYARNGKGMITGITSPDVGRTWTYGYDALDRLITADNGNGTADDRTYAYDDADNMTFNSALCASNPNLVYPAQGATSVRPHAPTSICGTAVTYDANGDTLIYDVDGAGATQPRAFTYGPDGSCFFELHNVLLIGSSLLSTISVRFELTDLNF
jgi:YD repeat-containing protein